MTRFVRICLLLCFVAASLGAHPHMWVDYLVIPEVSDGRLESIRVEWIFDEYFSSSLIMDMDTNKDREFQPAEVAYIRDNAFSHLIENDYFAQISIDDEKLQIQKATNFDTRVENGAVVYAFSIPVSERLLDISNVNVTFFDLGYYISFAPASDQKNSRYFGQQVSTQEVETLGWGEVSVPSLTWMKK